MPLSESDTEVFHNLQPPATNYYLAYMLLVATGIPLVVVVLTSALVSPNYMASTFSYSVLSSYITGNSAGVRLSGDVRFTLLIMAYGAIYQAS